MRFFKGVDSNTTGAQCQNVDPGNRVQCTGESEGKERGPGCCYDKERRECFVKGDLKIKLFRGGAVFIQDIGKLAFFTKKLKVTFLDIIEDSEQHRFFEIF